MSSELVLCAFLLVVVFFRGFLFLYFRTSSNIGFQLPLFLELIFVIPYFGIMLLGYSWDLYTVAFLYLLILVFQVALLPLSLRTKQVVSFSVNMKNGYSIVLIGVFIFSFGIVMTFKSDLIAIRGFNSFFIIASKNAIARYDGMQSLGLYYKVGSIFGFVVSFLIGMLLSFKGFRDKKLNTLLLFFFLFLLLDSFLMAARAGLLLQSFTLLSSFYFWTAVKNNGHTFKLSFTLISISICTFITIFLFFVFVQGLRGGNEDFDFLRLVEHVTVWFFGYLPAFSEWFVMYDFGSEPFGFGQSTFAGIFDFIGLSQRQSGVYDLIAIGNERYTNIFTVFRGFIHDFGLLGTFLLLFFLGFILTLCFSNKSYSSFFRFPSLMIVFLISWSFVISPYIYNTILLSSFLYILSVKYLIMKR